MLTSNSVCLHARLNLATVIALLCLLIGLKSLFLLYKHERGIKCIWLQSLLFHLFRISLSSWHIYVIYNIYMSYMTYITHQSNLYAFQPNWIHTGWWTGHINKSVCCLWGMLFISEMGTISCSCLCVPPCMYVCTSGQKYRLYGKNWTNCDITHWFLWYSFVSVVDDILAGFDSAQHLLIQKWANGQNKQVWQSVQTPCLPCLHYHNQGTVF